MHFPIRTVAASAIAAALALLAAGCATLNPDHFVPPPGAPAAAEQRLDGSVDVQAYTTGSSRGLLVLNERGELEPLKTPGVQFPLYPGAALRAAVVTAGKQQGLFPRIASGDADYVLDVWVIDAVRKNETFGEGYVIDQVALWRLTRVNDGAMVWADFAHGRAASRGVDAHVHSMEAATQAMIADGLRKLASRSASPVAAGIARDWPSKAPETPGKLRRMRAGWSRLRPGMFEAEVRSLVVPAVPDRPVGSKEWILGQIRGGVSKFEKGEIALYQPCFPFYMLIFVYGRLQRAEIYW